MNDLRITVHLAKQDQDAMLSVETSRERMHKLAEDALRESERHATADLEATTRLYELGGQCADSKVAFEHCLNSILETGIAITRADKGNIQLCSTPNLRC